MAQQILDIIKIINTVIGISFFVLYAYQLVFLAVPWLKKPKKHKAATRNTAAVLICARNEQTVLPDLLQSLKEQTYDASLLRVFVAADNCTDGTAAAARNAGATVYERFDKEHVGKGYALAFLLECIRRDCPDGFDTYYIIDADNLLRPDFIEQMNREFSDGCDIVTSYRNSKNYGRNWLTAGMGLWFIRGSRYLNHPRKLLGTSCAVSGTGFGFTRKVLSQMDGRWQYFTLTEDIEFTLDHVLKGVKIGMAQDAELFDEQPSGFCQSWAQRRRWARGHMQCYRRFGGKMLARVFQSFAVYDMCLAVIPAFVLSLAGLLANLTAIIAGIAAKLPALQILAIVGSMLAGAYGMMFVLGALTTLTEWKRLHTTAFKKILYTFTFPVFAFLFIPNTVSALFGKVGWKPIAHTVTADAVEDELHLNKNRATVG